jgi:eukaryotic-like serine/threonine-protein kinase
MKKVQTPSTVAVPAERRCPRCGAPLGGFGPEGLCGACLFNAGLTEEAPPVELDLLAAGSRRFGDYELLEEVARGGMGVVYRARQISLNRIVAVKMILSGQFAGSAQLARFRAEAQTAARLHHPNIVAIHEVDEYDGQPFFSMDYVEGRNLAQLVGTTPFPAKRAAVCLKMIAEAVHYAHGKGVLHRDLKPSNVLVDPNTNQPRVTDFGLAKRLEGDPSLTITGQVLGSPSFISPEQASGKGDAVRPTGDVYSLGAVLYHMLTARPPFVAETMAATLRMVAEQEPVSPRLLNASVPRDLETICLKCLQKESQRRYDSAQQLADDLSRFLHDEPVRARPVTPAEKLWRWSRRNRALAATLAATVVLLLIVAIGSPIAALRIDRERQRAEENARKAEQATLLEGNERARAERLAEDNRINLYAARIKLAEQTMKEGDTAHALQLLDSVRPQAAQTDLRGFEWYYLWQSCHSELLTLAENGRVQCVAFSSNGNWILSGGDGRIVHLWNAANGAEARQLSGQTARVGAVAFSPDSKMAAAAGDDGTVRIWDTATGKQLHALKAGTNSIASLAFSPDGRRLAAGEAKFSPARGNPFEIYFPSDPAAKITVWRTMNFELEHSIPVGAGVRAVAFSLDGRNLLSCADNQSVTVHEMETGRQVAVQTNFPGPVVDLALSPDGQEIAVASWFPYNESGQIQILDAVTLAEKRMLTADAGRILCLAISPTGTKLASAGAGQIVRFWDFASGSELPAIYGHRGNVVRLAFAPDGRTLASAAWDSTVKVWGVEATPVRQQIPTPQSFSVAFSPDGKMLASAGVSVEVRAVKTGQLLRSLTDYTNADMRAKFSPDGSVLAVTGINDTIHFWDTATWQHWTPSASDSAPEIDLADAPFEPNTHHCFSPDGQTLAMQDYDNVVRLWEVRTGKLKDTITEWTDPVISLAFTPDGKTLVAGSSKHIAFWDLAAKRLKTTIPVEGQLFCISPDGHWLASRYGGSGFSIWELSTMKLRTKLVGHNGQVYDLAFSHDGGRLASASWDGTVKLWHVLSGQELLTIPSGGGVVWSVAFAPDDRALAFGSGSNIKGSGMVTLLRAASDAAVTDNLEPIASASASAWDLYNAASRLRDQRKFAEAETNYLEALASLKRNFNEVDPAMPITLNSLAAMLRDQRRWDEAGTLNREAIELSRKLPSSKDRFPLLDWSLRDLGYVLVLQGKLDLAEASFREALDNCKEMRPEPSGALAVNLAGLVDVLRSEGKYIEIERTFADIESACTNLHSDANFLLMRAGFFARRGMWNKAADDEKQCLEFEAGNERAWFELAPLLIQSGDVDGYRRHRQVMLARFAGTNDAIIASTMAKSYLLLPVAESDSAAFGKLANAVMSQTNSGTEFTKSLIEYRQDHWDAAVVWTERALSTPGIKERDAEALMVQAIARHRLNQTEAAHAALAKGSKIVETELPKVESGDVGEHWDDWIVARALMSEAGALIEKNGKTDSGVFDRKE